MAITTINAKPLREYLLDEWPVFRPCIDALIDELSRTPSSETPLVVLLEYDGFFYHNVWTREAIDLYLTDYEEDHPKRFTQSLDIIEFDKAPDVKTTEDVLLVLQWLGSVLIGVFKASLQTGCSEIMYPYVPLLLRYYWSHLDALQQKNSGALIRNLFMCRRDPKDNEGLLVGQMIVNVSNPRTMS